MINRILIYDPVPYKGGSKKVMQTILTVLPSSTEIWVLSNDKASWSNGNVHYVSLFSPSWLLNKTSGTLYFFKHFIYFLSLFFTLCKLKRFNKIIGISGPCVDFSLYLLTTIIQVNIIQLIQGTIANSKLANFGLTRANRVFYLPSTYPSIMQSLLSHGDNKKIMKDNFIPFINGIDSSLIKSKVNHKKVGLLWAASLLRWKHIELFVAAINKLNKRAEHADQYFANVCYIQPKTTDQVDISNHSNVANIHWYADPKNLNDIRASSSIFISTSEQEPFGLSILEAMVSGLAIIIPADNAYWDQQLTDGYDCVKYKPNSVDSLIEAITRLMDEPSLLLKVAQQGKNSAQHYSHINCYEHILKSLLN